MKKTLQSLGFCLMLLGTTGCEKEIIRPKTPGELAGEKIMQLVKENSLKQRAWIIHPEFGNTADFEVQGQYLLVTPVYNPENHKLLLNLNELKVIRVGYDKSLVLVFN